MFILFKWIIRILRTISKKEISKYILKVMIFKNITVIFYNI